MGGGGGADKESDLVGRNTAAWGRKPSWPWIHFRSFPFAFIPFSLFVFFIPPQFSSVSAVSMISMTPLLRLFIR